MHTHTYIHMDIYDIWITLEQKRDQRREGTGRGEKKRRMGTEERRMLHVIKVHDTSERNYLHYTQYWVLEKSANKGEVQNKNLNAGKTLPFSMCSALFLRSSKSTAAARILPSSHACWGHVTVNAPCMAEWGWKWEVFKKQVFYLLQAARSSPYQSYICHSLLCISHLIANMESRTLWTWKACWEMR